MAQTKNANQPIEMAGIFRRFSTGVIVVTPAVEAELTREEIFYGLARHCGGDWGDLGKEDREANDKALEYGGGMRSRYRTSRGTRFWIITEHDRSRTTILLPLDH